MSWHLQIRHTEWVFWSYFKGSKQLGLYMEPASITVDGIVIDFKLPKNTPKELGKPKEVERKTGWGWRFKSNDLIHNTGWEFAESKEELEECAKNWVETSISLRDRERPEWMEYLRDVREINNSNNWALDLLNNS